MHPSRFEHARFLHALAGALLLGAGLILSGCGDDTESSRSAFMPSDTITSAVDRDSALAVLSSMERAAFDSAFAALDSFQVTRHVRTEQLAPTGSITALQSYILQYPPAPGRGKIQSRDSVGTFAGGGIFGWVAPDRNPRDRPANVADQVLDDQPTFVEPRTREAFRYALRADSLQTGGAVYLLEATARQWGTGRDQGVRYARLVLDRSSRQLIGLTMVRSNAVLLFSEDSRFHIRLRRAPGPAGQQTGPWVPDVTRVRSVVAVPFRIPRQFRTVSAFYDYRR